MKCRTFVVGVEVASLIISDDYISNDNDGKLILDKINCYIEGCPAGKTRARSIDAWRIWVSTLCYSYRLYIWEAMAGSALCDYTPGLTSSSSMMTS
jgi:hypothetical protein